MWSKVSALAAVLALANLPAWQETHDRGDTNPVFRAEGNLVLLDISVTDGRGRPATSLLRNDFAVYENGIQQRPAFFSNEKRPVSWSIVLDRSGSMMSMMQEVFNAALHSIEAGTREDEVFISAFNHKVDKIQDFTSERGQLVAASKSLWASGSTALFDAVAAGIERLSAGRHTKKVLVVVTDGDDNASAIAFSRLLRVSRRTDATIYAIGLMDKMASRAGASGQTRAQLVRLAEATGGIAYFPKEMQQCERACRDIAEQVSQQYTLGYYPIDQNWDGRCRDIKVVVSRSQDFTVRTRQGYCALRPVPPAPDSSRCHIRESRAGAKKRG